MAAFRRRPRHEVEVILRKDIVPKVPGRIPCYKKMNISPPPPLGVDPYDFELNFGRTGSDENETTKRRRTYKSKTKTKGKHKLSIKIPPSKPLQSLVDTSKSKATRSNVTLKSRGSLKRILKTSSNIPITSTNLYAHESTKELQGPDPISKSSSSFKLVELSKNSSSDSFENIVASESSESEIVIPAESEESDTEKSPNISKIRETNFADDASSVWADLLDDSFENSDNKSDPNPRVTSLVRQPNRQVDSASAVWDELSLSLTDSEENNKLSNSQELSDSSFSNSTKWKNVLAQKLQNIQNCSDDSFDWDDI